jgi:uncharacterized protein YprB with RNaseH-like and TPR domain
MDLTSRLRAIVRTGPPKPAARELTYEPDVGRYESTLDLDRVSAMLGGTVVDTSFGRCLVINRRYESDRWHGDVRIGDCELRAGDALALLDPSLHMRTRGTDSDETGAEQTVSQALARTVFIDLETTGLSGGAGTVAFLVGLGFFDLGAFQVRQFLLTSHSAERALLAAVSACLEDIDLLVSYNGKTFDVPVMETRWVFHRMELPFDGIPHFDMLHPARRLWKVRTPSRGEADDGGCRLATLERTLFDVRRVGDVPGGEIPRRFFTFLRTGDPRPLEPVLEHNRLDLVSLAAVTARAVRLAEDGVEACRDASEALALGRVYERGSNPSRAESCYRRAARSELTEVRGEALYRLGLQCRRARRFEEAASVWRELLAFGESRGQTGVRPGSDRGQTGVRPRSDPEGQVLEALRQFAAEALAIHEEHRVRDYFAARELAMFALEEISEAAGSPARRREEGLRHRLARLDQKISRGQNLRLMFG